MPMIARIFSNDPDERVAGARRLTHYLIAILIAVVSMGLILGVLNLTAYLSEGDRSRTTLLECLTPGPGHDCYDQIQKISAKRVDNVLSRSRRDLEKVVIAANTCTQGHPTTHNVEDVARCVNAALNKLSR